MKISKVFILGLLVSTRIAAQDTAPVIAVTQTYQVLSESTVQQKDGSTITFRQVVPPAVAPPVPAATPAAPVLTAAQAQALSETPVKETTMLSISASVHASGLTVLRWTCGTSQRLEAASNVDFRYLEGLGSLETAQASYFIILSAGGDDQPLTDAETLAAQSLPVNGSASFVLAGGSAEAGPADEAALDAMEALLDYYDAHQDELVALKAQRDADRAARELAALNAPPPPPRHSVVHFWPLQPAQRAAILEKNAQGVKGGSQP